jgi:hypothetical protein
VLSCFTKLARHVRNIRGAIILAFEVIEAQADVARDDYAAAEKRLQRVSRLALPDRLMTHSTVSLLTALVALKLGKPQTAADLVPQAVHRLDDIRFYANPVERAYLKYVGRLILEEATVLLGDPRTLDVGVEYDDLDSDRVRSSLREAFPVHRSRYASVPNCNSPTSSPDCDWSVSVRPLAAVRRIPSLTFATQIF